MRAVAYQQSLPVSDSNSLLDVDLPNPSPGAHDLLVAIKAIAVNPVDTKIRMRVQPEQGEYKVLGWDAAGEVVAKGKAVQGFEVGDAVYYAGDLNRPGSNAELQCVDARLAAKKPASLSFAEAAALPLTALTAWEMLFDRLQIPRQGKDVKAPALLITAGAGGVGSIALQLARELSACRVFATASRQESRTWAQKMGAEAVLNHRQDLLDQAASHDLPQLDYVASLTHSQQHYVPLIELMRPQSRFALIDDPEEFDIKAFKRKSISVHWEFMYTRSMFQTEDMAQQGHILAEVARLVDAGRLCSTLGHHGGSINAANLRKAHQTLEEGTAIGKIVLEGFD